MPPLGKRRSSTLEPELLLVDDLSAGIDLRRSPSLLKANRAIRLRNWSLEEPGALLPVPGWLSYSTASLGAGRVQGGERVYLSGLTFTLAAFAGSVYKPSDAGVWGAAVLTGLSASNELYFPYDREMVAVFDGATVPKKTTNGTTWTQMGVSAPTVAPTGAAVAGGSLTAGNQIQFSYSYVDDALAAEGNESATGTVTPAGANLTAQITVTGSPDPQVDTIYIYARDITAGETIRRKAGSVATPGSGLTATVNLTSNTWSTGVEAPTTNHVPPALAFGLLWKNRWWARDAVVKNRLRFSQLFEPQSWPTLFYIDIPFEHGDEIAAMVAYGDTLVVFGRASKPFLIIGQTSLDFEVRPSASAEAGALGPRAVDVIENGIIHAAAEGVFIFDGASDRLLSYDIDPGWRDAVTGSAAVDIARVAVQYHRARKEVRIAIPRLYPYGTAGEWVLDLNRTRIQESPAWTSTDRTIGGYLPFDGNESTLGNRGRLFSWSDTIGKLFEEAVGTSADGADLVCDYYGPTFTSGIQMARVIELFGEYAPVAGTFGLEVVVDGKTVAAPSVNIGAGLAQYGTAIYGTATYAGAGRKTFVAMMPLAAEGRSIAVAAAYRGTQRFRWYSYALSIITEPALRGL